MPFGPILFSCLAQWTHTTPESTILLISEVCIGMLAVVIIDFTMMKQTSEEICDAKKNTEYQNLAQNCEEWSLNLLVDIESVRACNRPRQPCLWFESRYSVFHNFIPP